MQEKILDVLRIFTSPHKGEPMTEHTQISIEVGVGLVGDRYPEAGAWSGVRIPDSKREVSLISTQGIKAANLALVQKGLEIFRAEQTRRNLVVSVSPEDLESLIGEVFVVGEVVFQGTEACTPCTRPAVLVGRSADGKAFVDAFEGRGGIRAQVIKGGMIYRREMEI